MTNNNISESIFTTESGICYELTQNCCGGFVLDLAFDPQVLAIQSSYETSFLIVDCKDNCDGQAFLLGLGDQDEYQNVLFNGDKIFLPDEYDSSNCQNDLCSLEYTFSQDNFVINGFTFDVTCGGEDRYVYQYTGTDNGTWEVLPVDFDMPIVLDLTGNGLLVYDANNDNTVTNASEFVLTDQVPGAKTDLEALRMGFDTNQDNTLDQQDSVWNQFGVWQDANQDAIVDNGEYHTLAQLGIVSIGLASQGTEQSVNGNIIHGVSSFAFADGSTGTVADVALRYLDGASSVHNDTSVTDPAVSNPTVAEQSQVVMAQNDPVVQSALDQMTQQAAVASA